MSGSKRPYSRVAVHVGVAIATVVIAALLAVVIWQYIMYAQYQNPRKPVFAPKIRRASLLEVDTFKDTPPHLVQQLYQLMHDVHEVFTENQLDYRVEGGTLLGAVRHGGLIPWDNDLDLQILERDEDALVQLAPQLLERGYVLVPVEFGYKIYPTTARHVKDNRWFPSADVFVVTITNGRTHIRGDVFGSCYFTEEARGTAGAPLTFGPLTVLGPHDASQYLDACYGTDWPHVQRTHGWDHENEIPAETPIVAATMDSINPALPPYPLHRQVPRNNT